MRSGQELPEDALPPAQHGLPPGPHAPPYAPQAIAQLAAMFPSLSSSAVADVLGGAGGDVPHAVDALLQAAQVSARLHPGYAAAACLSWDPRAGSARPACRRGAQRKAARL